MFLSRRPQFFFTIEEGGKFFKLDDPQEIEVVSKIKGVGKCRNQNDADYQKCWG
jgi:hypothetical protein